ncbi:DNA-binding transcriptional regulator, LysR family [Malonomonas rubra DSM 5091]|uniref:DNA-binding transcriptional regulator, LysR family n=1 Tax=Malonomonas rubra DSM 5091 TaxID=1122189 RepID=A0A1M6CDH7_MALRU|nr:LysR family transcriptional regulator [Malonomonas rubra]SHI58814.1 DNA-binding transcriptional regulator, LysR family [Malonomonas rubra DSM 5091]
MDRFREMETFMAVVDAGSFVAAAEKMRISKSVVSRVIQELEARLGGRLLNRTTRRLSLTDVGQAYYQRCKHILEEVEVAENAVGKDRETVIGILKVSAPLTFGTLHLAQHWGAFLKRHPLLELDINLLDRRVDLVGEGYDLAIRIVPQQEDSSLVSRKLASSRMVTCAAPEYLEKYGTPQTLNELSRHELIGYSYLPTGDVWKFSSSGTSEGIRINPRLRVNNGDTCRAIALQGLGITVQPSFIVQEDLMQGRLVEILPEWQVEERGIYAVYPTRQHLSGKVRALVDYLADKFKDATWNTLM